MLHRVVIKRSGRRAPAWDASDFTAADHLICRIVRQARNFPSTTGILHVEPDRLALEAASGREAAAQLSRGVSQIRKLAQEFTGKIP